MADTGGSSPSPLYNSTGLHEITPITRGARASSLFRIQNLTRDDTKRTMPFALNRNIQSLSAEHPDHASVSGFTGHYHKLLQQWSEL